MKRIISVVICLTALFTTFLPQASADNYFSQPTEYGISIEEMYTAAKAQATAQGKARLLNETDCAICIVPENEDDADYEIELYEFFPEKSFSGSNGENVRTFVYSVARSIGNTQSNSMWDSSYSVRGYITVTYNTRNNSTMEEYLLTNVSGGWEISDPDVTLSNRSVTYYCFNPPLNAAGEGLVNCYPSSNTFSYRSGFSEDYYILDSAGCYCGATSSVTIKHGSSSSWTLTTSCNVVSNYYT